MSSCMVKSRSRNLYAAVQVDPDSAYITPGTLDLEQLFWTGTTAHYTHFNEVWPDVYIGDECVNLRTADVIVLISPYTTIQSIVSKVHYDSFILSLCLHKHRKTALERPGLKDLGITHILNAAEGKWNNVLTGAQYYRDMEIQYYGVEADDKPTFNISQYFRPAANFIHEALVHPQSESCGTLRKPLSSLSGG